MEQQKIAIINDLSGYGRCSITVALPILSAMKICCGIIPTAILSNHTEYPSYTLLDFTPNIPDYMKTWEMLGFHFDGVYTGFLGSEKQIQQIEEFIHLFSPKKIIVDPVMGDHGNCYDSYTKEMCDAMKKLVQKANIITPNLTELCILTDHIYRENLTEEEIQKMCNSLHSMGIQDIIVTGIEKDNSVGNAVSSRQSFEVIYKDKIATSRPGTGDVFASIVAGCFLNNIPAKQAVDVASDFIITCLKTASMKNIPINDGVCFEEHMDILCNISNKKCL